MALFKLIEDSEAFINFSASARSGLSEPGREEIHCTAFEKMLNLEFAEIDFRGVKAFTRPKDCLDDLGLMPRVDF